MCGRYYIEIDEKELWDIANEVEKKIKENPDQMTFKTSGEIFPTDTVPVRTAEYGYQPMRWGFIGFDGKPVINARSETALQKPMFKESMLERRCVIPASGYYEWRKDGSKKTKFQFFIPSSAMYFAGCWRHEKSSPLYTFVILTRAAAGGVEDIHDRMPVIIPEKRIDAWLYDRPEVMDEAVTQITFAQVS